MLVIWAGIHKLLVRMGNREDPDQTDCLGLSVRNFRTFTVTMYAHDHQDSSLQLLASHDQRRFFQRVW